MANKYSRHQSVINRQSDDSNDHWLKQFEAKLQKGAVQPQRERDSLFDQINSIMNGKSKYPSVQAAVDDMMQRSGLVAYLKTSEDNTTVSTKTAATAIESQPDKKTPRVIQEKPSILRTLENIIRDTKGNLSVPAIISRLHSLHANDIADSGAWEEDNLIRLVSQLNLKAKADNPTNYENFDGLGRGDRSINDSDIDSSNTDAFHSLMPAKI